MATVGVVVAADQAVEWMLPWWWKHYSKMNRYPVVFIDLGMSQESLRWCSCRGELVQLPKSSSIVQNPVKISSRRVLQWESRYTAAVWKARPAWFQKPAAFQASPFTLSLWLDVDCEVAGSLEVMFHRFDPVYDLALIRDPRRRPCLPHYNSGVVLYKKGAPFLEQWNMLCRREHSRYMGDENILSKILRSGEVPFCEYPSAFNWLMYQGVNMDALIYHWGGAWGKEHIRRFGGIQDINTIGMS